MQSETGCIFCYIRHMMTYLFVVFLLAIAAALFVFVCHARHYVKQANKLLECRHLEPGWDGYDAKPIPKIVCDRVEELIESFNTTPFYIDDWEVFPTGRETIQIERNSGGIYAEVEVYADKYVLFVQHVRNEYAYEREFTDLGELVKVLKQLPNRRRYLLEKTFYFPKN